MVPSGIHLCHEFVAYQADLQPSDSSSCFSSSLPSTVSVVALVLSLHVSVYVLRRRPGLALELAPEWHQPAEG